MAALQQNRLQRGEHYRTRYTAVVESETSLSDVLKPAYWLHVASSLRVMDTIDILCDDESWFAELIVTSVGKGYAKVQLLREIKLEEVDGPAAEVVNLTVKWSGPKLKWAVIRNADGVRVKDGFTGKGDAARWASNHEKQAA